MIKYIEFESAISFFRKIDNKMLKKKDFTSPVKGFYLLTDFFLHRNFEFDEIRISRSEQIFIGNNTFTNVSKIEVPKWTANKNNDFQAACFCQILSVIISFCSERNVAFCWNYLDTEDMSAIAAQQPLIHSGPGAIDRPREDIVETYFDKISQLLDIVNLLSYEDYVTFIRSCRLFQLAQKTKYVDHNLSYALIVASIEANATKAIKIEDIQPDWKSTKKKIKEVALNSNLDSEFTGILYTKLEQHYTGARFQKFMMDYTDFKQLDLESRYEKMNLTPDEILPLLPMDKRNDPHNYYFHSIKESSDFFDEFQQTTGLDLPQIFKDSYKYRSSFFHEGKSEKFNKPDESDRYIKFLTIEQENAYVMKDDFEHLGLDPTTLAEVLRKDYIINKINQQKFFYNYEKIAIIKNEHFNNLGAEIRQVFYNKIYKRIPIASFNMLSQIARIAATQYYSKMQITPNNQKNKNHYI